MDTSGRDWWLSSQTDDGRERYPDRIRVGSPGSPRVYVPERTCRPVNYRLDRGEDVIACACSECGEMLTNFDFEQEPPRPVGYCPSCGAKVIGGEDAD